MVKYTAIIERSPDAFEVWASWGDHDGAGIYRHLVATVPTENVAKALADAWRTDPAVREPI
jgi:hypothetical protein